MKAECRTNHRVLPSAFCLLPLSVVLLVGCRERESAKNYNLLLITIDTIRADHVGAYGSSAAKTPVMDRLARDGVRFQQATSAVPLTLPSHATILTGLLPPQHGVRNNGGGKLPENFPTLATELSRAGYRTGAFIGAFVLDRRFGLNRGFETYDDDIAAARADKASLEAERPAVEVVGRAVEWLRKPDARPFFAWVHLYDPHAPYTPPEPFRTWFPVSPYAGEIAYVDNQIGRLLDELARLRIDQRTAVVVVGDHGEALGEHGELTHGVLLYEPSLHVPLILNAPGALKPGVVDRAVSLAGMKTTLLALLALQQPEKADLLSGTQSDPIYAETEYPTLFGWSGIASARQGALKFIETPEPELYDLAADPQETKNLYGMERRAMRPLLQFVQSQRAGLAKTASPATLDAETARKLASLGYVAPSGAPAGNRSTNPRRMIGLFRRFEEATWDLSAGRTDQAVTRLDALVRDDPSNAVFRSTLAKALRQKRDYLRAIEMYREAVALRPDDADAWYNLAATFQEAGDQRRAAEAVREAIRRDPSRPEAHNVLGIAYSAAGRLDAALEQFRQAAAVDPRNARAFNNAGNVLRSLRRYDEAERAYRRAIELDASYADPWNGLGTLQIERGRPRDAVPLFDRALALAPSAHEARLNRAVALQLAGDVAAAVREYRAFIQISERDPAFARQRQAAREMLNRLSVQRPAS